MATPRTVHYSRPNSGTIAGGRLLFGGDARGAGVAAAELAHGVPLAGAGQGAGLGAGALAHGVPMAAAAAAAAAAAIALAKTAPLAASAVAGASATGDVSTGAAGAPLTLAFDQATPHQITINAVHTRALAEGSTATVDYRVNGSSTWINGGALYRTRTSNGSAADAFAGWIVDLVPGTTYDIRLNVTEPGVGSWQPTGTRATRALPAEGLAANKTANPGNFSTVMAGLVSGDVVALAAGTYSVANFSLVSPGTPGSPVVIRGADIDQTIIDDTGSSLVSTHYALDVGGSHITFEDLTIRGSNVDSDGNSTSIGVVINNSGQSNITFRRCKFDGCDQGIKVWSVYTTGLLVYDCEFVGNNPWSSTYTIPGGETYPNLTWNDTGVHMPGLGNCVWNNTFHGFGDTVKMGYQGVFASRACFVYRNWVKRAGDDAVEFDESGGNCAAYDNLIANSSSAFSMDGIVSGPIGYFRNVAINQTRFGCGKFTSTAKGARIHNNTFVGTARQAGWDFGMYNAAGDNYDYDYRNNVFIYRGAADLISSNQFFSNRVSDYSAWYPDNRNMHYGNGTGTYNGLTAAKAGLAPLLAHDVIVASDPFASAITLGADYTTEYTGHMDARITSGAAKNAGVAIAGVTDGFAGAAPDMGAYIEGRTMPAIGAASNPYVPEWARTQASQTWAEIPMAATLDNIDPIKDPLINPNHPLTPEWSQNTLRQSQVVDAWCGATYDEATDTMWLGLGGGHTNYAGNEIYACRFADPAPRMRMVRKPSGAIGNPVTTNDGQEATGLYSDGRPRAIHTYNKWVYVPGVGPVIAVHGASAWAGGAGGSKDWSDFFNESNGEANFTVVHSIDNEASGLGSCYDPVRRAIWFRVVNTGHIYRYDIPSSGNPWGGAAATPVGPSTTNERYQSLTYLPTFDCILIGHSDETGTTGGWRVFDCALGVYYNVTFTGTAPMGTTQGMAQPRWVPALGAVCAWNNLSNRTQITKFTPGANPKTNSWQWAVSALPVAGGVTPAAPPQPDSGPFTGGRFAYSPRMGGFIVFSSTVGPHYFYKI